MSTSKLICAVGLAATLLFPLAVYSQTPSKNAALEFQAAEKQRQKNDVQAIEELLATLPENATVDELNAFYEDCSAAANRREYFQKFYNPTFAIHTLAERIADKLLAKEDLTPEQRLNAIKQKVFGISYRKYNDPQAAQKYVEFIDRWIEIETDVRELQRAYSQKFDAMPLVHSEDSKKHMEEIAEQLFQQKEELLQILAIQKKFELSARALKEADVDRNFLDFLTNVTNDDQRAKSVKNEAFRKQYTLLCLSALYKNRDNQASPDFKEADELFYRIFNGNYSKELKKSFLEIKFQTESKSPYDYANFERQMAPILTDRQGDFYATALLLKGDYLLKYSGSDPEKQKEFLKTLDELLVQLESETQKDPKIPQAIVELTLKKLDVIGDLQGIVDLADRELAKNHNQPLKEKLKRAKNAALQKLDSQESTNEK